MAAEPVVLRLRGLTRQLSVTRQWQKDKHGGYGDGDDAKWVTLPPFTATLDASALGNQLSSNSNSTSTSTSTTALKWVIRCCPHLPRTLVHKLFRLRQVRRLSPTATATATAAIATPHHTFKRVAAKDALNSGDRIFLPQSAKEMPTEKHRCHLTAKQINFIRSLVMYKDPAILVLNKPPGIPVQGGVNIKWSLDVVAAACLNYEYSEPPRLIGTENRILLRRYWALVIGCPRRTKGLVTASLGKVVVDNGKSDRITIVDNSTLLSSQHAITEYRVIGSSSQGYTWLELSPLTGRKHQLRVHCAEVLGTPIVGDYKYGWQAHRNWGYVDLSNLEDSSEELLKEQAIPFGLNLNKGSISEKRPRLHLHCKQIVLPNVSQALQNVQSASNYDLSRVESLELVAALPPYMQRSWDITNS